MVTVLANFGQIFADLGMGSAIIQKKNVSLRDSSTVFWVNCLMGLIIGCSIALFAPAIAAFYAEPVLQGITWIVGANLVFHSLGTVQKCLLQKQLNFRNLFYADTLAVIVAGIVGIIMAFGGWGVWSLVAKLVVETVSRTLILWVVSPWRPLLAIDRAALRYVLHFGMPLVGSQSLNYWARNIDNLMIGRVWGDIALGNYNKAYSLMLLPLAQITAVISRVIFPSLAKIQDDPERVKRIFLQTTGIVALFGFPISIGIFVTAETLILTLYGDKWAGSIELLRILSLLGINQSVGSLNGIVYQSQNATMLQFKWGMVVHSLCIAAIFLGLPFGALGVAIAYTAMSITLTIPNWMILSRVIPVKISDILLVCSVPFFASLTMGILIAMVDFFLMQQAHVAIRLMASMAFGGATYFGILASFRVAAYEELKQLLLQKFRKSKSTQNES